MRRSIPPSLLKEIACWPTDNTVRSHLHTDLPVLPPSSRSAHKANARSLLRAPTIACLCQRRQAACSKHPERTPLPLGRCLPGYSHTAWNHSETAAHPVPMPLQPGLPCCTPHAHAGWSAGHCLAATGVADQGQCWCRWADYLRSMHGNMRSEW